jgi:glucose-6-phosphate isomerase
MLSTINFTSTSAYKALQSDQVRLASTTIAQLFQGDSTRQSTFSQSFNSIFFDYSKNLIDDKSFQSLVELAKEC